MITNLIKKYSDFLELDHLNDNERKKSLLGVFKQDIEDNENFKFKNKKIYPVKISADAMQTLFTHLTCCTEEVEEDGRKYKKRVYDAQRSKRLHWVRHHIDEKKKDNIEVFSSEERIENRTVIRTYIYDLDQNYIIVLEPQRTNQDYYLITAHYLNEAWAKKAMRKRLSKKLPELH